MDIGTLIAVGCLFGGIWSLFVFVHQYLREQKRSFVPVVGTVVYVEAQYGLKGRNTYTPVYQYEYGGQVYQKAYGVRTQIAHRHIAVRGPMFVVGSSVALLVDRDAPEYVVVNDYSRYTLLWQSIGLFLIGLFAFG